MMRIHETVPIGGPIGLLGTLLAVFSLVPCGVAGSSGPASAETDSITGSSAVSENHPEGFLAKNLENPYWKAYRAVIFKTVCDSLGQVKDADVLYDFASDADTDSLREVTFFLELDRDLRVGRISRWRNGQPPPDPDLHFLVPYPTPGGSAVSEEIPSREELESAGLGPWLTIWDEVLPGWPVESWKKTFRGTLHEINEVSVEDSLWVEFDMLSVPESGPWRLHPFYGMYIGPDGKAGFDVDGGFILYRVDQPGWRQLVTGTPVGYDLAGWLDNQRFVIAGTSEAGLSYPKQGRGFDRETYVSYRTPVLYFGRVDRLEGFWLKGPPIPIWWQAWVDRQLKRITKARYPKVWKALR